MISRVSSLNPAFPICLIQCAKYGVSLLISLLVLQVPLLNSWLRLVTVDPRFKVSRLSPVGRMLSREVHLLPPTVVARRSIKAIFVELLAKKIRPALSRHSLEDPDIYLKVEVKLSSRARKLIVGHRGQSMDIMVHLRWVSLTVREWPTLPKLQKHVFLRILKTIGIVVLLWIMVLWGNSMLNRRLCAVLGRHGTLLHSIILLGTLCPNVH